MKKTSDIANQFNKIHSIFIFYTILFLADSFLLAGGFLPLPPVLTLKVLSQRYAGFFYYKKNQLSCYDKSVVHFEKLESFMSYSVAFAIDGMSCDGCAKKVSRELNNITGINAEVSFALEKAQLQMDSPELLQEAIATIQRLNYTVEQQKLQANVSGMTCEGCANSVKKAVIQLPQVIDADVNFATETLQAIVVADTITLDDIKPVVKKAGYSLHYEVNREEALAKKDQQTKDNYNKQKRQVIISCLLTAPLLFGMVAMFTSMPLHLPPWLEFVLATPVQFFIGWRYYTGAFKSLQNRSANMDVLVAMGTSAAYFYSVFLWLSLGAQAKGQLFFEASAVVITLITLGKLLETKAKHSTTEAIRQLMSLRPDIAWVLKDDQWQKTPIDAVKSNDIIRVLSGERIPVDGEVIKGHSDVNEALITGESLPLSKEEGDAVIAGSINGQGQLQIKATQVGEDTSLAKIIHLVEQAQMGKAPIQQLVDKVSSIFVPVVLVIALITFVSWLLLFGVFADALIASVCVLVIACPCALGLATPAAIVTGTGVAAKHGILIKDVDTLQKAHKLQAIVFDKTGTLTLGEPSIIDTAGDDSYLTLAASLQQSSDHPLAKAIVQYALDKKLTLSQAVNTQTISGFGIKGQVNDHNVLMGNADLLRQEGITAPDWELNPAFSHATQVYLSVNGEVKTIFALADKLRPSSKQAIDALHNLGIKTLMISGDNQGVVNDIASQLGLDDVHANIKPENKASILAGLRNKDLQWIAMVGDGINDAPALAEADVGIAMGSGTDVAMETATITLMRPNPLLVVDAIDISKATWSKIKQNLFWAFIFNTLGIPLAAFGFLNPMIAGGAMAFSSIMVLGNSLLLNRWKAKA